MLLVLWRLPQAPEMQLKMMKGVLTAQIRGKAYSSGFIMMR